MTARDIDAARTAKGGWTRETLASWGVPWPPPAGWKQKLITDAEQLVGHGWSFHANGFWTFLGSTIPPLNTADALKMDAVLKDLDA